MQTLRAFNAASILAGIALMLSPVAFAVQFEPPVNYFLNRSLNGIARADFNRDGNTDLVATALGGCMLTVMGIMARTLKVDITGATATVEKEMANEPVRRIARLTVKIHVPHALSDKSKVCLERAAHTCPVHKSLHPDIEAPISFTWG